MNVPRIADIRDELTFDLNGDMFHHKVQTIPDDFLDDLKSERLAKAHFSGREFNRVASIPVFVVEIWKHQGRDFENASAREIVGWLRKDGLDAFVTARNV